jgi:hypothetical protein
MDNSVLSFNIFCQAGILSSRSSQLRYTAARIEPFCAVIGDSGLCGGVPF